MNIDLTSCSTVCDVYEKKLDIYKLSCHVPEPTRKGKKLINISTNINKI